MADVQAQPLEARHAEEGGEEVVQVLVRLCAQLVAKEVQDVHHGAVVVVEQVEGYGEVLQDTCAQEKDVLYAVNLKQDSWQLKH